MSEVSLPYALKNNKLVHISEVEAGLCCDCFCPCCQSRLVARKGGEKRHHFAHYSNEACSGGLETAAHLLAKEVLSKAAYIVLPPVELYFETGRRMLRLADARKYKIDRVRVENSIEDIRPDLILTIGGRDLIVEVFVTHKVDDEKVGRIKRLGVSAIEIDLSHSIWDGTREDMFSLVTDEWLFKNWIFNVRAVQEYDRLIGLAFRKPIIVRGFSTHVDLCPLKKRASKGRPYANFNDDCVGCDYLLEGMTERGYICCIGHLQDELDKHISQ